MINSNPLDSTPGLFDFLLGIGDDLLILGHRNSEWCGHGPVLEEDIALANIALDCVGQATGFLTLAAAAEGKGRTADDLAFLRSDRDFRNLQLVEQPNGDFGKTIVRQLFFDAYALPFFTALSASKHTEIAGLAGKALKETAYHIRHARDWFLRLALGTDESRRRIEQAVAELWEFTFELGAPDTIAPTLISAGIAPDLTPIRSQWEQYIEELFAEAGLKTPPADGYRSSGSRCGIHTEHLGHLLAEMQSLQRAHPGASW